MKKKILSVFSVLIIVALLVTLGALIYVIYDQIVNFGVPDSRDDDTVTTAVVTEVADPSEITTSPEETSAVTSSFDFISGDETAIDSTAPVATERVDEAILDDGSKEVYSYDENGNLTERVRYDAQGNLLTTYKIIYENGKVSFEKQYNAQGKLEVENAYTDETVSTTTYFYDENGNVTSGMRYVVHLTEDEIYEEHTLNQYGGVIYSKYVDANGMVVLTREHHFTAAGYRDGYTETDKDGKRVRYNDDGTVRVEETTAATTTTAVTTKPKPKPATTTAAKTTTATTKPKPAEPSVVTETSVTGSDKVVKYYNVDKNGAKTLSNTITYRTIAGKELVLTNIDEIRGYGRQNEYDANGNLLRYLTYNVKYGKRTLEILYDASGNVTKRTTYEYNDEGKKIKESTYDAADNLTGYITYEYIKTNSGSKTKIVTYNAKGQQVSSVVR